MKGDDDAGRSLRFQSKLDPLMKVFCVRGVSQLVRHIHDLLVLAASLFSRKLKLLANYAYLRIQLRAEVLQSLFGVSDESLRILLRSNKLWRHNLTFAYQDITCSRNSLLHCSRGGYFRGDFSCFHQRFPLTLDEQLDERPQALRIGSLQGLDVLPFVITRDDQREP